MTAVGLATFAVVTTEMLPVGLLSPIAGTVNASLGTTGLMISVPAILAALFAPAVVLASGDIDRRTILCGLLVLLIGANIASALSPSIQWLLAARVVVGFCMGGIWGIAGGLASRLVPAPSVGLATAIIFGGVAAASVLGVPLGVLIGDFAGWRMAFWAMAMLGLLVLLVNFWSLPALPVRSPVTLRQLWAQTSNRRVQLGLATTLLMVAGHFMAFTFVRPLLQSVSGIGAEWIGVLLFAYGAAGIAGNFLAGAVVSRQTGWTLMSIALGLVLSILAFHWLGASSAGGAVMVILWGVAYGGVSVSLQSWMMKAAPAAIEAATSLFVATFNVGIAMGAYLGGRMLDALGLQATILTAGSLVMPAFALAGLIQADIARRARSGALPAGNETG